MTKFGIFRGVGMVLFLALLPQPVIGQDTADDPEIAKSNQMKARFQAETEAYNAAKARSEAEAAAAKSRFGPLADYETEGKVEAGENSGKLEAALLAAEATRLSARRIVEDLCNSDIVGNGAASMCSDTAKDSVDLIILTDADKPAFDAYDAFKLQLDSINAELTRTLEVCPQQSSNGRPNGLVGVQAVGLPAIATAVSVVGNLLRSDYKVSYLELSQTDAMLIKTFVQTAHTRLQTDAGKSVSLKARMIVPSLFPQRVDFGVDETKQFTNAALRSLQTAREARDQLSACADKLKKPATAKKAKKQTEPDPRIALITKAIDRFDGFESKLATADANGVVPLAAVVRQAQMTGLLDRPNTYVLQLKADMAGGSAYTKKNFATFLGAMPFSISGGSLVSYALLNGKGDLIYADVLPQTQPFMKMHTATARFLNGRPR